MQNFEASFSGIRRGGKKLEHPYRHSDGLVKPISLPPTCGKKKIGFFDGRGGPKKFFFKNFFFFVFSTFWAIWDIFHFFEKKFLKNFFGPKGGPFKIFFFKKFFEKF